MAVETISEIGANGAKVDAYTDVVGGKVQQVRGRLQETWGALTDNDADRFSGRRDQLAGILQEKYGYTRAQAIDFLKEFVQDATAHDEESSSATENATLPMIGKPTWKSWLGLGLAVAAGLLFWQGQRDGQEAN